MSLISSIYVCCIVLCWAETLVNNLDHDPSGISTCRQQKLIIAMAFKFEQHAEVLQHQWSFLTFS